VRPLGPRSDKAHVAAKDVDQLRELIDSAAPDDISHACAAVITFRRPRWSARFFRVLPHRSKFKKHESFAVQPDSFLREDHWTWRVEFDCQCHQNGQGRSE